MSIGGGSNYGEPGMGLQYKNFRVEVGRFHGTSWGISYLSFAPEATNSSFYFRTGWGTIAYDGRDGFDEGLVQGFQILVGYHWMIRGPLGFTFGLGGAYGPEADLWGPAVELSFGYGFSL